MFRCSEVTNVPTKPKCVSANKNCYKYQYKCISTSLAIWTPLLLLLNETFDKLYHKWIYLGGQVEDGHNKYLFYRGGIMIKNILYI